MLQHLTILKIVLVAAIELLHSAVSRAADSGALPASDSSELVLITGSLSSSAEKSAAISVIEREAIDRAVAQTPVELLNGLAGVHALEKGGAGGSTYLSIRGGEPNYSLVLLEGVKANDPTNSQGGSFDLAQVDPAVLRSIEVYRGALSAVHGADALSGVVNLGLLSLGSGESLRAASVQAHSEGGWQAAASLGGGWSSGNLLFSVNRSDSGELYGMSQRQRQQGMLRAKQSFGDVAASLLVVHGESDRLGFPEDSGGQRLAANRELEQGRSQYSVLGFELTGAESSRVTPSLKANESRQRHDTTTPAIFPGVFGFVPAIQSDTEFQRREMAAQLNIEWPRGAWVIGGSQLKEHGQSNGAVDFGQLIPANFELDRTIRSFYTELQLPTASNLAWTLGARFDDPDRMAGRWTARASLRYELSDPATALYANVAEGFKLPSLYALAYPLIANPALQPERSRSAELGWTHSAGAATRYRLAAFYTHYTDMIDFDPALFTNVNRSWVIARGVEIEAQRKLTSALRMSGNLTWLNARAIGGTPLRSRPRWQGDVQADWQVGAAVNLHARLTSTAGYNDSSVPTGLLQMPGFATLDLGLNHEVSEQLSYSIVARNLLDRRYEQSLGTPSPGRHLAAAVRWAY